MKTINKEVSDALHMLFNCSLKDTEYTTQRKQFREVYNYIEKLEDENKKLKQPTIFIDTQDMEERYGEQLYQDYLEEENKDLKQRIDKTIKYIEQHSNNGVEYLDVWEVKELLEKLKGNNKED